MRLKYIPVLLMLFLFGKDAAAQFTFNGKISYERKVNMHKLWGDNEWMEEWKDKVPKFQVHNFEMNFTTDNSYYKPGKEADNAKLGWGAPPGIENEVFMDFKTNTVTANKQIYEQKFLVQDSMRKLKWRITEEFRIIAGYKCRKAVTRICDSVYIVAFYADDIPVSGGPEQFGGLPGMILELAVPRLYTTWVATDVAVVTVKNPEEAPFSKGKKITRQELTGLLQKSLKDWGKYAAKNIWWSSL